MKSFILTHKLMIILCCLTLFLIISIVSISFGMVEPETPDFTLGVVNTDFLNLRTGPGIDFDSIGILTKNAYLRIYGKIGDWYIVQNDNNQIGSVHSKYVSEAQEPKASVSNIEVIEETSSINNTTEENQLLDLINAERSKNHIPALSIDDALQNVARLKAQDLVQNNYFSHTSPTYGTPFEMLKNNHISYKTASENIAGNSSIEGAVSSWMNSASHKENILSNDYNYTGIAVVDSIAYGKIIVELFVGK